MVDTEQEWSAFEGGDSLPTGGMRHLVALPAGSLDGYNLIPRELAALSSLKHQRTRYSGRRLLTHGRITSGCINFEVNAKQLLDHNRQCDHLRFVILLVHSAGPDAHAFYDTSRTIALWAQSNGLISRWYSTRDIS